MMFAAALLFAAQAAPPTSLLLVTIDTLRADRVGCYGYPSAATPALDRLAREGVLVEDAVVQVPQTRPSHASMFTGRYPFEHGLRDNYSPPLDARTPTLAALLQQAGYDTAAFIGAYPVSRSSGLDRGFSTFDDPFGASEQDAARVERPGGEVVDRALRWLGQPRSRAFFAWVHLFDPHAPYEPPAPYRQRFARRPYDGEVAYADAQVARLLEWLDRSGMRSNTLVVVTSDHGEGLGAHGEDEHLLLIYDSTLRVPLLLSWPGRLAPGTRVPGQFRSIDLLPTLLELLGQPAAPASGVSRASVLRPGGWVPDNESYAESLYGQLHFGWAALRSLRGEGWKLIDGPRPELYRVADDPGEAKNVVDLRGNVAEAMRSRLRRYNHDSSDPPQAVPAAVDSGAAERLAALGYLGGGLFQGTPSGADPRDKLAEFQAYRRDTTKALRLYREGRLEAALPILTRLSRTTTTSFNVEYYLGRALDESGRPQDAVPHLQKAVELAPTAVPAQVQLARALSRAGRLAEALGAVERGLKLAPENPQLVHAKGALLLGRGDAAAARPWLERARALDPRSAAVRVDLATLHRSQGELEAARGEAEAATRLAPKSPDAQVALGLALGALRREGAAGRAFRAALTLAPDHRDALYFLASVELRAGRSSAALPLLEKLTRVSPDYPGAGEALDLARRQIGSPSSSSVPPDDAGRVSLRLIRIRDRARADEIASRARAGQDFAVLAREVSEDVTASSGGALGLLRPAELAEPLRRAASALKPGEVSPVLETSKGYVILKRER